MAVIGWYGSLTAAVAVGREATGLEKLLFQVGDPAREVFIVRDELEKLGAKPTAFVCG